MPYFQQIDYIVERLLGTNLASWDSLLHVSEVIQRQVVQQHGDESADLQQYRFELMLWNMYCRYSSSRNTSVSADITQGRQIGFQVKHRRRRAAWVSPTSMGTSSSLPPLQQPQLQQPQLQRQQPAGLAQPNWLPMGPVLPFDRTATWRVN